MQSNAQHQFSQVPSVSFPRSGFDRSHGYKTTFDAGYLVPIYVDEVLPGDTFNMNTTVFGRLATPLHPFMDNMYLDFFWFFVPNRLLWDKWQRFMGEQINPGDSIDFLMPTMTSTAVTGYLNGSLHDYLGLPTAVPGLVHRADWHRAYNQIWNQWFRDQNMQNSVPKNTGDGPDAVTDYVLLKRGKRHDYFTSALPWPQKGPSVLLPLGSSAPVVGLYVTNTGTTQNPNTVIPAGTASPGTVSVNQNTVGTWLASKSTIGTATATAMSAANYNVYADLSGATAASINQFRQSYAVQKLLERDARGGTRYTEIVKAQFGVTSPDARLQRPEFMGSSTVPLNVNPIAQTSATATQPTPAGNLAAMGTFHARTGFTKSFTEHGVVIGLCSARADLNYQQGINRMWTRSTRYDFYTPDFANLGEQVIQNKEIYAVGTANPTQDAAAFGYQERWAEYRYKPSVITGQFRSNFAQTLDTWHLAQNFAALPTLNDTFIQENPPVARVIAVPTSPAFLLDCSHKLRSSRPMPMYSVPGLTDRF